MNGRQRGASLAETAIVSLLVFSLIFAILEFALVFRDYLTVGDAVGDAARMGAVVGPDEDPDTGANADFEIVRTLRDGLAEIPLANIERIVIFDALSSGADDPLDQIPAACRAGTPVAGRCNVYEPAASFVAAQTPDVSYFACSGTGPACAWPATSRDDGPDADTIDYIGVYVRVRHDYLTGIIGSGLTIERATVVRLEPGTVP